ncbi:GAF domain-containing protein [Leptolyngbya sp. 7M]|uniref:GAF domain-containing protein n=1 Tax=Leptolyngbya sp. 7M TaxID=2812896 RepID=UPI001B8C15B8|nr:GAF domain-containing protein [Leptolyngbya sp. 7M]QYO62418.1 GAF domain-containing protein [Leptolyngbya sp. 7M]
MSIDTIHGQLQGLKSSQLKQLQRVYHQRLPIDRLVTPEFAQRLAAISTEINQPVCAYLNRRGQVIRVGVGTLRQTQIPPLELPRYGAERLSGIRCIATQLKAGPPSEATMTTMAFQRLDALVTLTITGSGFERRGGGATGYVKEAYLAHLLPDPEVRWTVSAPLSPEQLSSQDFNELISDLEEEFRRQYVAKHVSSEQDGNYCWLQDEAKLIRDAAGAPVEIIGYCIDITSRKTAELALQQLNTELEQRIQSRTAALQESEELFRQFTENIPKVFWMEDLEGNLLYVSPRFAEVWGIPTATLYQNPKAWLDAVHPEDRIWMAIVAINRLEYHEEDIEYRILQSDTDICWIRERAFPIYNSQGAAYRVARIAEDITAQKQAEAEIHRSRDLFEAVFQESADAVFLVDPVTLLILNCNQRAVDLFEANHTDELIGIQGHTLHRYPFWGNDVLVAQQQLAANGVWSGEIEYCTLKGHFFWGSIAAKTIHVAGRKMTLVRVSDISQRKQSEQLLQQQANREALLRQVAFRTRESLNLNYILTTSVNQVQAFLQTDRVLIFQFEPEGSGYIAVEAVSDPQFSILGARFHDPCFSMQVAERYQQGHTSAISDIYSADLTPCYVDFLAQSQVRANLVVPILQDEQLWGLLLAHHCTAPRHWQPFEIDLLTQFADQVGIAIRQTNLYDTLKTQLSERRRAEQALAQQVQYEQLLQTISQQIRSSLRLEEILAAAVTQVQQVLQVDRALVFRLYANGTGCVIKEATLPQYPVTAEMRFPEEQFPLECRTLYQRGQARAITNVDTDILADCLVKFMHQIQVKSKLVVPIVQSDEETGSTVWGLLILHSCAVYRQWQPAEVELMQKVAVQMGIAIQQSELYVQLETQLKQKEILIKEIHHRVKNNLQVISAMLKLQARVTQDTAVLDVLEDSRNRLRAIGLIHEILYRSNDLEQLNFDEYIQKLANTILATHSSANQVRLVYQLQPVCLNLDTAIPCGLLLNELITNAIKHAFPNGPPLMGNLEQRQFGTSQNGGCRELFKHLDLEDKILKTRILGKPDIRLGLFKKDRFLSSFHSSLKVGFNVCVWFNFIEKIHWRYTTVLPSMSL